MKAITSFLFVYMIYQIQWSMPSFLMSHMTLAHEYTIFLVRTFFIRTLRLRLAIILRTCHEHTQAEWKSLIYKRLNKINKIKKCNNLVWVDVQNVHFSNISTPSKSIWNLLQHTTRCSLKGFLVLSALIYWNNNTT